MTENQQKQQLSVAHIHAVVARAGYACQVINVDDDSVDVQLAARGRIHERAVFRSLKMEARKKMEHLGLAAEAGSMVGIQVIGAGDQVEA